MTSERSGFCDWFKQSKPTEWITAIATILGLFAVYWSGIIDQKRSELEIKRSELTINNIALEAKEAKYTTQLAETQKELAQKNDDLANLSSYYAAISSLARMKPPNPFIDTKDPYIRCELEYADDQATVRAVVASAHLPGLGKATPKLLVCARKGEFISSLVKLNKVPVIRIEDIALDRGDLVQLSAMPILLHLHLFNCGLTDAMVEGVVFRSLASLSLCENHLTKLPRIDDVTKLTSLNIGRTCVGDEQAALLLPSLTACYSLSLDDTAVTDLAIESLHPLGSTEGFATMVDIHGTHISLEGVKKLVVEKRVQLVAIRPGQFEVEDIRRVMQEAKKKARVVITPWAQFDRSKNSDELPEMIPANGGILAAC